VRQQYCACDDKKRANAQALDGMMRGVDSLAFCLCCGAPAQEEFEQLMKGIYADAVEVNFVNTGCKTSLALIEMMAAYAKKTNANLDNVCGSTDFNPLKKLTEKGFVNEQAFEKAKAQIEAAKELSRWRTLGVSGSVIHNAGGTIVQELAFALAMGNEYLSRLTDMGLAVDEVARRLKFTFSVGASYFIEIAKFRAARLLWANIVNAYQPEKECSTRLKIHAETSAWNQTAYDAYVNMLRGTTEAMSAALAGVDSLEVLPFDAPLNAATDFSNRIARNTQILLKEESHFDQVVDPAAGSYYIETLTQSIADEAWKLFRQVEEKGGYVAAFKAGFIQEQVNAAAQKRDSNIATRRDILLGTNQYPNFNEALKKEVRSSLSNGSSCGCGGSCGCASGEKSSSPCGCSSSEHKHEPTGEPLKRYRGAQAFEELRVKTENAGRQPQAFMLTFGSLAMCRARAQFACNFFAVAGFKVVDNNRFAAIDEGVKAALAAKADIIVACSSDDDYAEAVPQIAAQLGKNGILVVAGDPACKADLEAKGISHFISMRSNVLETLRGYQKELGV
jgi:methylmalonyl-CoA mutase